MRAGYSHIDTAEMYGNEREVGEAVRISGLDRAEVFVTTKLGNGFPRPDDARRAFGASLDALGFDCIDLFLIHWAMPTQYDGDYTSIWKTLEEFYRDGRVRSIGVSNFRPQHLRRLRVASDILPAVNQIEAHPDSGRGARVLRQHQIAVEGWSPMAQGRVLEDPVITSIAARTGKSPALVVLRWHIERGDMVFPKSVTPARIKENIDIFDFQLSDQDLAAITALNRDERTGPDPDTFGALFD